MEEMEAETANKESARGSGECANPAGIYAPDHSLMAPSQNSHQCATPVDAVCLAHLQPRSRICCHWRVCEKDCPLNSTSHSPSPVHVSRPTRPHPTRSREKEHARRASARVSVIGQRVCAFFLLLFDVLAPSVSSSFHCYFFRRKLAPFQRTIM